jgi:hypothetical protein
MKQIIELTQTDLKEVVGGQASFGYRVGQTVAILWDLSFGGQQGVFGTYGGLMAVVDWFG